jgi:hypothetical protein
MISSGGPLNELLLSEKDFFNHPGKLTIVRDIESKIGQFHELMEVIF